MRQVNFEGTSHSFPDDATDAEIASALQGSAAPQPQSSQPSWWKQNVTTPVTQSVGKILAAPGEAILQGANAVGLRNDSPEAAAGGLAAGQASGQKIAPYLVPQTPLGQGAAIGSAGILPAARLLPPAVQAIAAAHPALTRILGGAVGGEVGGEAQGAVPGVGAAVGGATTAVGEGGGKVLSWIARSLPGAKGAISDIDATRIAGTIGEISPTLKASMGAGIQSAKDLKDWVLSAAGNKALGTEMKRASAAIDAQIGKGGLQIPSMMPENKGLQAVREQLGLKAGEPLPPGFEMQGPPAAGVSLGDAWKQLGVLGQRGYGGAKEAVATRTVSGLGAREERNALRNEIETALQQADPTGKALAAWKQAVDTYREGLQPLRTLRDTAAGRIYPTYGENVQLNTAMLQQRLSQNREVLERKLGPENFQALADAINRGAPVGGKDVLQSGPGGALDALRMLLSGKGGSAAAIRVGSGVGELLPNATSRYIGQQPLPLPPELQVVLDAALQQKGARAAGL